MAKRSRMKSSGKSVSERKNKKYGGRGFIGNNPLRKIFELSGYILPKIIAYRYGIDYHPDALPPLTHSTIKTITKHRAKTIEEMLVIKKYSMKVDKKLLTVFRIIEETTFNSLVKNTIQSFEHLYFRLEVLKNYGYLEYSDPFRDKIRRTEKVFESEDVELPIHADQLRLSPRDKLVYRAVEECMEYGGAKTIHDIAVLLSAKGDRIKHTSVGFPIIRLKSLGLVRKDEEYFGYEAFYISQKVFIADSDEFLIDLVKKATDGWKKANEMRWKDREVKVVRMRDIR